MPGLYSPAVVVGCYFIISPLQSGLVLKADTWNVVLAGWSVRWLHSPLDIHTPMRGVRLDGGVWAGASWSRTSEHHSEPIVIFVQQVASKRPPDKPISPASQVDFRHKPRLSLQLFTCFHGLSQ